MHEEQVREALDKHWQAMEQGLKSGLAWWQEKLWRPHHA